MGNEVIISAALVGSRPTKEMNPAVPITPQEIIQSAVECHSAGAAIVHIHVRDPETGKPEFRMDLFKEIQIGIRARCDLIVNMTTSGLNFTGDDLIEKRLQPVALQPEICSFDLGSVNFVDKTFINPPQWGEAAAARMQEKGVKPEIEAFDVGHIYQALHYIEKGLIDDPPWFQLCMGVRWGIEATPDNYLFMKDKLPANALWSVLGVGRFQFPMVTMALITGGHVRVGFEDNIYIGKGELAKSNAHLVEKAATLAQLLGRPVASPNTAREMLKLKSKV